MLPRDREGRYKPDTSVTTLPTAGRPSHLTCPLRDAAMAPNPLAQVQQRLVLDQL